MYNYLLHLCTYLIIKQKHIAQAISSRKAHAYTPFVILSEPRTGSTLLHTYLNFHSNIWSYGEVFREKLETGESIKESPLARFVYKPHARQLQAVGMKLFYSYHQHPEFGTAFAEVLERSDVRIIHLVRKDVLQQYVSLLIARQTQQWSASTTEAKPKLDQLNINIEDWKQYLHAHFKKRDLFKSLFRNHELLTITYEDLKDEPEKVLEQVQLFLGVKPKQLKTLLQKQNTRPLETFVQNYKEARRVFEEVMQKRKA